MRIVVQIITMLRLEDINSEVNLIRLSSDKIAYLKRTADKCYLCIQELSGIANITEIDITLWQYNKYGHNFGVKKEIPATIIASPNISNYQNQAFFLCEKYLLLYQNSSTCKQTCPYHTNSDSCNDYYVCTQAIWSYRMDIILVKFEKDISVKKWTHTLNKNVADLAQSIIPLYHSFVYIDDQRLAHIVNLATLEEIQQNYQYCYADTSVPIILLRSPTDKLIHVWHDCLEKMITTMPFQPGWEKFAISIVDNIYISEIINKLILVIHTILISISFYLVRLKHKLKAKQSDEI